MNRMIAALCFAVPLLALADTNEGNGFSVTLTNVGPQKIQVIKQVRTLTGLGLAEAKKLVESPMPVLVKGGLPRGDADAALKMLVDVGATATLGPDGAQVKVSAPPNAGPPGFSVRLDSFGAAKIGCIKVVRDATGLGLKETKELVESAPAVMKQGLTKEAAQKLAAALNAAGGTAVVETAVVP